MFKILLSLSILYSFSTAEETIFITEKPIADPSIEKLITDDAHQDGHSHYDYPLCLDKLSLDKLTERITPSISTIPETVGKRKQIIHFLVPNSPTAAIIEVPHDKHIKTQEVDIKLQLNKPLTTHYPSSVCKHTEISTSSQEDQYLKSYLRASEIFPMPD